MVALREPHDRPVRKARPMGEKFDPAAAAKQAEGLYSKVMAKRAECVSAPGSKSTTWSRSIGAWSGLPAAVEDEAALG